ncbi:MAG TPA: peptide chain release factor 1 [Chloroflexota bacterium]|jgi:peptide chain release factor 1|nr:peptide chain release factor 1 [Chloroflexota bacterium]
MNERLSALEDRFEELGETITRPEVMADHLKLQEVARERSGLEDVVTLYRRLKAINQGISDTGDLLAEDGHDPEFEAMAREELAHLESQRDDLLESLKVALVPVDPDDERDVVLEVRGAAGGDEAALFARDLFRMYTRLVERRRWKMEILSLSETGGGGIKEAIARIQGKGAYSRLKFESGVHRVQRVPTTESSGRIHTSTVTVIVLPEIEDVDVDIKDADLRVDVFRSSGHGGQSVNTTDSAVRIIHLPTGIVATSQNERSQIQNRASAMAVLRSRIYEAERQKREAEAGATRRSLVQTGDRSEKIRTYNFPQDRVTDHRIGLSVHNLPGLLEGDLDPVIDRLAEAEQKQRLEGDGAAG